MTEIILCLLLLFAVAAVGLSVLQGRRCSAENADLRARCLTLEQQQTALTQAHEQAVSALKQQQESELQHERALHAQEKAHLLEQLQQAKEGHAREQAEQERRWEESRKTLEERFKVLAGEVLKERSTDLKSANNEQMNTILAPLREQLESLGKTVAETRKEGAVNKAALETTIREMMTQAQQIGKDAVNLTNALKGNSKTQGDWGEMILEQMLEKSGLKRDEHYFMQKSVRDENGKLYRPDVVVRFPRERSVIIDSKVSLTAYAAYMAAEDEAERRSALKAHVLSVRKHIDELAAKDYTHLVKEAIGYVLMFMPNEAGYIAAVQEQPDLPNYAYSQNVLLVSPTNLHMALQLAANLWRNEAQVQNVEAIYARATQLYEKFQGFQSDFINVGEKMRAALVAYDGADKKLSTGAGNFVRQVEMLRDLGVKPNPKKRLVVKDDEEKVEG